MQREIGLVIPFFAAAFLAVAQSNMILTVPKRMALKLAKSAAVRLVQAPRELKRFKYKMTWHPRSTADPVLKWFRAQVRAVAKEL